MFLACGAIAALITGLCLISRPVAAAISAVLAFLIFGTLGWLSMPTLNWGFFGLPFFIVLVGLFAAMMGAFFRSDRYDVELRDFIAGLRVSIGVFLIWIVIVPIATSWSLFHAESYRNMIGKVPDAEFTGDVSPVDIKHVRTVTQGLASRVGEKRLGEIPGLGSRVDLGEFNLQILNGCFTIQEIDNRQQKLCFDKEPYWAAPLIHSGPLKQMSNDFTPGYILVSATDVSKTYMVTALVHDAPATQSAPANNGRMGPAAATPAGNGGVEPLKLRYLNGGYFSYNLTRHLVDNGYMTKGLTDYSFEVRDDGRPFWVVTVYEPKIGFFGEDAVGVVTVDAQTGAIESYDLTQKNGRLVNVPAWIDRVQPESFVKTQLDDWGQLVHGWINFGHRDMTQTTKGMSLVFGADGRIYWYTGLQSVGADEGTVGFVLVDSRTKAARWYKVAGATETAARYSAENTKGVKEAGYTGTDPVLYNVAGVPTYFTVLHGQDGLPKMYAFISVQDYTVVGVGKTPHDALRDYQISLSKSKTVQTDDLVKRNAFDATVQAITTEAANGNLFYYLLLEGKDGKEYYASADLSVELKWTKPGDKVTLTVDDGTQKTVNIISFDNQRVHLQQGGS